MGFAHSLYQFGDFRLDPKSRTLLGPDGLVTITAKAFDALVFVVEHAGELVERSTLTRMLWPKTIVEDNNLNQAIGALRRALGDGYIVTIPGRGYQFVAKVAVISEPEVSNALAGIHADPETVQSTLHAAPRPMVAELPEALPTTKKKAVGVGIALAGALALATVSAVVLLQPSSRDTAKADASAGAPQRAAAAQSTVRSTPRPHSIAVLPFANLSPNEADAYFAIGIHEDILNQLTKLGSLRVVARTTVQQYVDTQKTISAIARELNVETVMEGTVRYADGRVLVTTQLIDGATDVQLWSDEYEHEFENIFAIQSDIAVNVAQALKAELLPADRERIDRVPTTSLRAYDLYLSAAARGWRQTGPEIQLGLEEVDEATAIDPNFALAWALKADLRSIAPYFDPARAAEHQARGAEAARRAIELDPALGKAHAALGFALFTLGDWSGSEAAFRTALSLNTPLGDMPAYSPMQLAVGHFAYAHDILQEARESVPQNPSALAFLVMANALLGEWETAKEQYELGTRLFTPGGIGDTLMIYLLVGHNEPDAARRIPPSSELDAAMLAKLDTPQAALLELRRLYEGGDVATRGGLAPWAAHFGDSALALEGIRAAATQQGGILMYVWLPQFAEARRLPQFKTLMRDMGVVAYWQEYGWPAECRPRGTNDFECD